MKVLAVIKQNGSATSFQLVSILNWPINRISGRISELCSLGEIYDSGRRKMNPATGRNSIVWMATK